MLPQLPKFKPLSVAFRPGSAFNAIRRRLIKQTLLSSASIKITNTANGQRIDRVGGGAAVTALSLGFLVTHTGANVTVAAGKVLGQSWSGASGSDFKPSDWTTESNFVGGTLSASATEAWLKIELSETDTTSEGNLLTEDIDISGGAGGRGGGGGGGGAAGGATATTYPDTAQSGQDGDLGGAGGVGGYVRLDSDNSIVSTSGGYGGEGAVGGAGGAGADGTSVTFTRPTKSVMQVRHYTISGLSIHTTKGSPSETASWVKLATISGTSVVQHHIGTLRLTPAVVTFLAP